MKLTFRKKMLIVSLASVAYLLCFGLVNNMGLSPNSIQIWNGLFLVIFAAAMFVGARLYARTQRYLWFLEGSLDALQMPITTTDKDMKWVFINKVTESLLSIHNLDKKSCLGEHCSSWKADICGTEKCGIESLRTGVPRTTYTQEYGEGQPSTLMSVDTAYIYDDEENIIGHIESVTNIEETNKLGELTQTLSASLEETSASIEELSKMVESNLDGAEQASTIADDIRDTSTNGDISMQKLVASMDEIKNSNDSIQEVVKIIEQIGEKTKAIDEIVFQTKLLSFNASVEAERAGENGRGFAVVAQEVGNLAQLSGKSAKEISDIVSSSLKHVQTIGVENDKRVQEGTSAVEESAVILKSINGKSLEINGIAKQVLAASKDQHLGIKQINEAVTSLENTALSNASYLESSKLTA